MASLDFHRFKFLKEVYEKEDRHYCVYDHYRPNYITTPVTGKFYSRSVAHDYDKASEKILNGIRKHQGGPKEKSEWPVTTNQEYGWILEPLVKIDRNDDRFYHPNVNAPFLLHEMKINADITMKRPKFVGIPFVMN